MKHIAELKCGGCHREYLYQICKKRTAKPGREKNELANDTWDRLMPQYSTSIANPFTTPRVLSL